MLTAKTTAIHRPSGNKTLAERLIPHGTGISGLSRVLMPCTEALHSAAIHPVARSIVYPLLKNIGGSLAISGAVTDWFGDSGSVTSWMGLGLFAATTITSSAAFFQKQLIGRHLAESFGDGIGGVLFVAADIAQALCCKPDQEVAEDFEEDKHGDSVISSRFSIAGAPNDIYSVISSSRSQRSVRGKSPQVPGV